MVKEITWDYINKACKLLRDRIIKDGKEFDYVYGIPRGGLIIGVLMSHLLNIPLILNPKDRVLICDDITDSGLSMKINAIPNSITLTIHKDINSKFTPDYYYEETDEWVLFPWETLNTSKIDYKDKT